jgi:hypothetical protein
MIDKILLFDGGSIGWLFLIVNGHFYLFCIKKQGPAMRQGKKDGAVAALLESGRWLFRFESKHFHRA